MKTITVIVLALLAQSVQAQEECPELPVILSGSNPTPEYAAIQAFAKILLFGRKVEYGGIILEIDGRFHISEPITQGSRSEVTYCIPIVPGWRLAAVYHSHHGKALFSERDFAQARARGVPSFLAGAATGTVKRYDPESGETVTIGTIEVTGPDDIRFTGGRRFFPMSSQFGEWVSGYDVP